MRLILGFILGFVAGMAMSIFALKFNMYDGSIALNFIVTLYVVWAFAGSLIMGSYLNDFFAWFFDKTISLPGVIFTLDIDGLIFLIAIKIAFVVIGMIFTVAVFIIGLVATLALSAVSFPVILFINIRNIKELKLQIKQIEEV